MQNSEEMSLHEAARAVIMSFMHKKLDCLLRQLVGILRVVDDSAQIISINN